MWRERERANSVAGAVVSVDTTLQRFNESIVGALIAAALLSIVQIHSMLMRVYGTCAGLRFEPNRKHVTVKIWTADVMIARQYVNASGSSFLSRNFCIYSGKNARVNKFDVWLRVILFIVQFYVI